MKITVIGTGYVGLTSGTCFAEIGHEVLCVDIDEEKINKLRMGEIPIYEPGLSELVQKNIDNGRLNFTTLIEEGIDFGDIIISAVGTPPDKNYKADLKFVREVAKLFGKHIKSYKVFVNKSTVPVGTGDVCRKIIEEELKRRKVKVKFSIVSNPEFLKEGTAIVDSMNPDRIVIGAEDEDSLLLMEKVYKPFLETSPNTEILTTDIQSAEIIKYASNAFLATKISFINEISSLTEKSGGNIKDIAKGMGLDKRIGKDFLDSGIGYGGSCFPKDVQALMHIGSENGYEFKIIKAVEEVNKLQKIKLFYKLKEKIGDLKNKKIAIWGLSFKGNTDDVRESPALEIVEKLINEKAIVSVFDPIAEENFKRYFLNILFNKDKYASLKGASALMILTDWIEFKTVDLDEIVNKMKYPLVLDGRNVIDKLEIKKYKINYFSIGQKD